MKAILLLLLSTGVAVAAPIAPPAGWQADPALATPPVAQRFAGATTKVDVWAYRAPQPGAVLYVNRASAEVGAAERDRIATIELDELRNALRRIGATAKVEEDSQKFDAAKKQLDASLTWTDANVRDSSRIVIAGDDKQLVAVTAQCVLAADAPADVVKTCEAALATIDTELPPASRVALSIVQPEPPPKPRPDVLDDGSKTNLPAIRVEPPKPERDMRPVYVGGGLVVFAAVFYWNRRRREKFEREHPLEAPPPKPDEDDLHAAAEAGDDGERKP